MPTADGTVLRPDRMYPRLQGPCNVAPVRVNGSVNLGPLPFEPADGLSGFAGVADPIQRTFPAPVAAAIAATGAFMSPASMDGH